MSTANSSHRLRAVLVAVEVVALLSLLAPAPGVSQTNDEVNAGLSFHFVPPGARSMGMGYAFSGLADDASAAYTNPAGLLRLQHSEVGLELRSRRFTNVYQSGGSFGSEPTHCQGPLWKAAESSPCLDTVEGLDFGSWSTSTEGIGYMSFVHVPRRPQQGSNAGRVPGWRLAAFSHSFADFGAEIGGSQGVFLTEGATRVRTAGVRASLDLEIFASGLAAALRIHERLWLGAAVSQFDFRLDATTRRFRSTMFRPTQSNPALPGPVDFTSNNVVDEHVQQGDDSGVGWTLGAMLRFGHCRPGAAGEECPWSVGLVRRDVPSFDFEYSWSWGEGAQREAVSYDLPNHIDPGIEAALSGSARFRPPSVTSLGISWTPRQAPWIVTFEVSRVGYSRLSPRSNILLNGLVGGLDRFECGYVDRDGERRLVLDPCADAPAVLAAFKVQDTTETHLGAEYHHDLALLRLSYMAGLWVEPEHQMVFGGEGHPRLESRFVGGETQLHRTLGVGLQTERATRLRVDIGFDFADRSDSAAISIVYGWH